MKDLLCALSAAALLLAASPAHADVIDPSVADCQAKAKGDACDGGTCQESECCRLDYSNGTPPTSVCGPCLECKPAAEPSDDPSVDPSDDPAKPSDEPAPAASPQKKQPEESSSCAAAGGGATSALSLLGGAFLLVSLRRRRRA